ncbi:hypothetical protein [Streptomyces albogriseolus]|uniref:hypothetical protein n=1 Tax=Streptomyces albogriseolus TaxID=1887 RepID=UPI0034617810
MRSRWLSTRSAAEISPLRTAAAWSAAVMAHMVFCPLIAFCSSAACSVPDPTP